jgi:hypothetical protein
VDASAEEVERKRRMIAAYASQAEMLAQFDAGVEWLRPMAAYDFSRPPHEGVLNYEAWLWPVTGAQLIAACAACDEKRAKRQQAAPGPGVREVT